MVLAYLALCENELKSVNPLRPWTVRKSSLLYSLMTPSIPNRHACWIWIGVLLAMASAIKPAMAAESEKPLDQLPRIKSLPDPFLLPDGAAHYFARSMAQPAASPAGFDPRLRIWKSPCRLAVKAEETSSKVLDSGATEKQMLLNVGPEGQIAVHLVLTIPKTSGRHPVIVKGDLCWGRVKEDIVSEVIRRGYMLAEFDRTDFAPDKNNCARRCPPPLSRCRLGHDCGLGLGIWLRQ